MVELSRRSFLRAGALAGGALFVPWRGAAHAGVPTLRPPSLDPRVLPKYVTPLVVPPAMPTSGPQAGGIDSYRIGVRQFRQRILPGGYPATTVWSYGSETTRGTLNYPAFTIEAEVDRPTRVTWVNGLVRNNGAYRPHLLPVDPTLHWANPPGGKAGRDSHGTFRRTPRPYRGPVPIVTHVHGAHAAEESDGYAEAWYLPRARNIPKGYARVGSHYQEFRRKFARVHGKRWGRGTATFHYDNDQPAANLWYHDHTLGITRLNVYAGPAGFYLLRGGAYDLEPGVLPGPAPARDDEPGTAYHEIPIVIQDRSFDANGALYYPDTRAFFDGFTGPYVPDSDIAPIWNPEFFGNTMVVNGRSWPDLVVERRRYRFRLLNGCNSRFVILKLAADATARPASAELPFWQVGGDGGFLAEPVAMESLLMAPAERADVVVDFSQVPAGTQVYLINEGPDEPFGGGAPGGDFPWADPSTTGQVMRFTVVEAAGADTSTPPDQLSLPTPPPPPDEVRTRRLVLLEADSDVLPGVGPRAAFLGTLGPGGPVRLGWDDDITESPGVGDTEVWELHNFTEDAHPIHLHLVQFEVLGRRRMDGHGPFEEHAGREANETGPKDTVVAFPGQVTRVRAHFDKAGLYVWHCHIVEHEDHEMMRPYRVVEP
ncbi:MAG TPA: multicopper oxidase domain-containing protein [Nocardioidaceae bacterium]